MSRQKLETFNSLSLVVALLSRFLRRRHRAPSIPRLSVLLLLLLLLPSPLLPGTEACGPGRGLGRRRNSYRLTPLVLKQHVPNVMETSLAASGPAEGRIERSSPRFHELVVSENHDIVFKNEEGTGADLRMSQRCRDKLNALSTLVINQWPGVRLRVSESWDEDGQHSEHSLHYEGRAVDVTTSDRDRLKLGMLARLAVEAGFDWVNYETRSHVHCSVKSDSSIAAQTGGCFPGSATVRTHDGRHLPVSRLSVGDRVLSADITTGQTFYDDVIAFLHRSPAGSGNTSLLRIYVEGGATLTLTGRHLVYVIKAAADGNSSDTWRARFADELTVGDFVLRADGGDSSLVKARRVTHIAALHVDAGLFAPLTSSGNIVVDDVMASCYAVVGSHDWAHWSMGPVRLAHSLRRYFGFSSLIIDHRASYSGDGIHYYAILLRSVADYFLPTDWLSLR